jgi:lipoprotein-releasing system permease protein
MNFPFFVARRYLFRKKGTSSNAINILSTISMLGITVGTMALIVILSVFNGFEEVVLDMYNTYSPDLQVTPMKGKSFEASDDLLAKLKESKGVEAYSLVIEENALLKYDDREQIVTVKGVDEAYADVSRMPEEAMLEGRFIFTDEDADLIVLGAGVEYGLGMLAMNSVAPMSLFAPKPGTKVILDPARAVNRRMVYPAGVFSVQQEVDMRYVYASLNLADELFDYKGKISAIEIGAEPNTDLREVHAEVEEMFGPGFRVRNRLQQDEELYRVLNSEKWVIFLILTLVLIIAAFNMVGSLSMLALEKATDIGILKTMGASIGTIRKIFYYEGVLQVLIGYGVGAILGLGLVTGQLQFGWFKLEGAFRIPYYPVGLKASDFLLVFATVVVIGLAASLFPAFKAGAKGMIIRPAS